MDIVATYDRAAPGWDGKIDQFGYPRAYHEFLKNHVEPTWPVLDVGTGTGAFALAWIGSGGSSDITLLDPSEAMLLQARYRFEQRGFAVRSVCSVLEEYRPGRAFRTVLAAHVIEHCDDPATALGRMATCLRTDGRLILVVSRPHWCNWLIWLRFRHRWFAPETLIAMGNAAGLTHIETHHFTSGPPSRTSLGYVFAKQKGN